ncbi:MAG: YdjY domain-containing protein [Planctomycetota bacterium]
MTPAQRFASRRRRCLLVALAACPVGWALIGPAPIRAADPEAASAPGQPDVHPELRRLSTTDEIWLDLPGKRVVIGGRIALAEGEIEVFACPKGSKEHEAIIATLCPARLVHAGLLAIGLEPGSPVTFDPEYRPATGPKVTVLVRWKDADGTWQERPAQELIRNTKTGEPLAAEWVFAGSGFWRDPADGTDHYQADGGDMICVSNFPGAMLDLPIESSDANESLLFEAFEGRVPPHGTAVELILAPAK